MKHAGAATLDALEPLLAQVRAVSELTEKKRGAFYLRSTAFLHFHEDPAGFFADLRVGADFERFPVSTSRDRRRFLAAVKRAIGVRIAGG